jgi:IS1 family transposase
MNMNMIEGVWRVVCGEEMEIWIWYVYIYIRQRFVQHRAESGPKASI